MNYRNIYVEYRRQFEPGYQIPKGFHVHHIRPKAVGGQDIGSNLIALHPDDHETIHKLRGDICAGRNFLKVKYSHVGELNPMYNRSHKEESKKLISKRLAGKSKTENHKRALRVPKPNLRGRKQDPEHIRKRIDARMKTIQARKNAT